jgi:hypothetical protein
MSGKARILDGWHYGDRHAAHQESGKNDTMNPLNSIPVAIVSCVVLAIIVIVISGFNEFSLARWLHILSGIMWIGLLYYINVAQIPALAVAAADKGGPGGAGITKYVGAACVAGFRWAAVATWLTGALAERSLLSV